MRQVQWWTMVAIAYLLAILVVMVSIPLRLAGRLGDWLFDEHDWWFERYLVDPPPEN